MSSGRRALTVSQTLQELLEANQGYLNWLDHIGARKRKQDFAQGLGRLASPPLAGVYYSLRPTVSPMIEIGGVSVSPHTHRSMDLAFDADPLNLIFTGKAPVDRVANIFMYELFPPELKWLSTVVPLYNCAETQWVYFESNGSCNWEGMRYTIAMGGCGLDPRCHIRLFDGGYDEQLGEFTLANVHYEHWDWSKVNHVIDDWDKPQEFVQQLFEAASSCNRAYVERLQSEEVIQDVPHDGLASVIELQ